MSRSSCGHNISISWVNACFLPSLALGGGSWRAYISNGGLLVNLSLEAFENCTVDHVFFYSVFCVLCRDLECFG